MEGVEGELIERLVACADRGVETEGSWYDIAIWVSHSSSETSSPVREAISSVVGS